MSCYIATVDSDESGSSTTADAGYLEPSTRLPAQDSARSQQVVGTLDLNQGVLCSPHVDFDMTRHLWYRDEDHV